MGIDKTAVLIRKKVITFERRKNKNFPDTVFEPCYRATFFFFFFFFFFFIIKYLLINFLHHLHYRTLIANTNYRTVLTILTIQIVLITILTLTLLIDTITALRKEEQKRWPTYLHSLLINAKTYRPFYLFTFVIRFFFFFL